MTAQPRLALGHVCSALSWREKGERVIHEDPKTGEPFRCAADADWRITRASFVNVLGEPMPGEVDYRCAEHTPAVWHDKTEFPTLMLEALS